MVPDRAGRFCCMMLLFSTFFLQRIAHFERNSPARDMCLSLAGLGFASKKNVVK